MFVLVKSFIESKAESNPNYNLKPQGVILLTLIFTLMWELLCFSPQMVFMNDTC